LDENINTKKGNGEAMLDTSKEDDLGVNTEKNVSRNLNAGRNHILKSIK